MSKSFHVEYSPEALDDLRAIYSYIAFHPKERETASRQTGGRDIENIVKSEN